MKFKWKIERWGVELLIVRSGTIECKSLERAKVSVCRICRWYGLEITDWGEWKETEIDLHPDWNALCMPPYAPAWERTGMLTGKPGTLTMWEVTDESNDVLQ